MGFWPKEIFVEEVLAPRDIMTQLGKELRSITNTLSCSIHEATLPDREVLAFVLENEKYSMQRNLFEVSYRPDQSYPVVIDPPPSDLPEFLQRERRVTGSRGFSAMGSIGMSVLGDAAGKTVTNEWVCATPGEFTEKLKKMLELDHVKSIIMSVMAPSSRVGHPEAQTEGAKMPPPEDFTDIEDEAEDG